MPERPLWGKADVRGGSMARMAEQGYFKRIRVETVGTAQITPPLPNGEGLNLHSRIAAQVRVEAGFAGRHN